MVKRDLLNRAPFLIFMLFLALCVGSAGYAQEEDEKATPPTEHKRHGGEWRFPEELKLTKEQTAQLRKIHFKYDEKRHDLMLNMQFTKSELALLLNVDNPDRKKIERKIKEIMGSEQKLQQLMLDEFFDVHKVLKPSQRKFFTRRLIKTIMK